MKDVPKTKLRGCLKRLHSPFTTETQRHRGLIISAKFLCASVPQWLNIPLLAAALFIHINPVR